MFLLTLFALLTLVELIFVSSFYHLCRNQRRKITKKFLDEDSSLSRFLQNLFDQPKISALLFSLNGTQHTLRVLFTIIGLTLITYNEPPTELLFQSPKSWSFLFRFLGAFLGLSTILFIASDIVPRSWAQKKPDHVLKVMATPSLLFTTFLLPLFAFVEKLLALFHADFITTFSPTRAQLVELLRELDDRATVSEGDRKLLEAVLSFKDKIAREIMMPRVGLFCIPEDMPIRDAASMVKREEYSRVPIYRGSIDNIVGVLLYKDLLAFYMQADQQRELEKPVKTLAKKVFYCPETKPIPSLLQELKKRQSHMAVVVDEYGGTSGIVTIEDILEEIVGRIEDEYDTHERSFKHGPKGSWIVDARMNLSDLESELGISLPQEDEYDTIAGYIFFKADSIPQPGTTIHHDKYEIIILKSNDRTVEEVQITPIKSEEC